MFWIVTILMVILALFYYKVTKRYQHWEERGVKYLKPTFLFGNVMSSTLKKESFHSQMQKFYEAFPNERYMGIYDFLKPILIVRDPELMKSIFVKDFESFPGHIPFVPDGADPTWSKNLLLLKGPEWRHMRSTLSPGFTSSKMRILFSTINETALFYADYIAKNKITKVGAKDISTRFTNDNIASVAYGLKTDSMNDKTNDFYQMSKAFTEDGVREGIILLAFNIAPTLTKALGITLTLKKARDFFTSIITETIKVREEKNIFRPDMISLLMEEKKKMEASGELTLTNDDIVAQAFAFLFAGFGTVSTAMTFILYELSRNPDCQCKLQDEIDEILRENGGKLTYESLMKMTYIEQVISETLRLWPPALANDRICGKNYVIEPVNPGEQRLELKPGDLVWASSPGLHRDPKYYPNPNDFDPERFAPENKDNLHPYTFIPFGAGPRICIGMRLAMMEIKTFLTQFLSKYTIVATSNEPVRLSKESHDLSVEGDIWIELKPRM